MAARRPVNWDLWWLVIAAVAVAGIVVAALTHRGEPRKPVPAPKQREQPAQPPQPVQAPVQAPQPAAAQPKMLRFPDGSLREPLNGVTDPKPVDWPAQIPYAPVVGRMRDAQGLEWYRHADGSRTTTQMFFHQQLGKMVPMTRVENPVTSVPVDESEAPSKKKN
jgi:hypothetical protein